jgi:T4 bacteriophage base plate protein
MPLPIVVTPTYELILPSNKKPVKYRPFLVKEEKLLILAMESGDSAEIMNAVKDVLKNCIVTKGIKVDSLPSFDIEYLFLNIRAKSVGEFVELIVTCPDDNETQVEVRLDVTEIEVSIPQNHQSEIKVDDNITVKMKYPSLQQFVDENFNMTTKNTSKETIDKSFDIVASCLDMVYTKDESWSASDLSKKEIIDWLNTFDSNQFGKIELFFDTMPKLSHTLKVKNPKTNVENEIVLEGLSSFFG